MREDRCVFGWPPGPLINAVCAVDLYHSDSERLENTRGLSAVIKPERERHTRPSSACKQPKSDLKGRNTARNRHLAWTLTTAAGEALQRSWKMRKSWKEVSAKMFFSSLSPRFKRAMMTEPMTMVWTEQDEQFVWCVCTGGTGATQIWAASPQANGFFLTQISSTVFSFLEYFCFVPPFERLGGYAHVCAAVLGTRLEVPGFWVEAPDWWTGSPRPPDSTFVPEFTHLCITSGTQRKLSRRYMSQRRTEKGFLSNPSYFVSSFKPTKM